MRLLANTYAHTSLQLLGFVKTELIQKALPLKGYNVLLKKKNPNTSSQSVEMNPRNH